MGKKTLSVSMHCACGESIVARVSSAELADEMMQVFATHHQGKGHEPRDPPARRSPLKAESRKARRA